MFVGFLCTFLCDLIGLEVETFPYYHFVNICKKCIAEDLWDFICMYLLVLQLLFFLPFSVQVLSIAFPVYLSECNTNSVSFILPFQDITGCS
jgi:hypothetical protein